MYRFQCVFDVTPCLNVATHYISNLDNFKMLWHGHRTIRHPPLGFVACVDVTVLNGTAGSGATEQSHMPMNQYDTGLSNDYS